MTRSVPEKTFEHWCSMHLSYRYRAKMLMWWPSDTADLDIVTSPQTWGKRFWLELKTTEWKNGPQQQRHDLSIDLDQLKRYGQQAIPDYYVFPIPPWTGVLSPSSATNWLGGLAPERLAYQSWSGDKWFTEWTWVVPGWALRHALRANISKLPTGPSRKNPHTIATVHAGAIHWKSSTLMKMPILPWRDFWASMDQCGGGNWPAQFLLPPQAIQAGTARRKSLSDALRALSTERLRFNGQVLRFDQRDGDIYISHSDGPVPAPEFNWGTESRALVALSERALTL